MKESPCLFIKAFKNVKWKEKWLEIIFSKASWEIYPSATYIWSLTSITRRKSSKKSVQWIFQKKDKEDIFDGKKKNLFS